MKVDKAALSPSGRVRVRRDLEELHLSYRRREISVAYGHLSCMPILAFLGFVLLSSFGDYHGVTGQIQAFFSNKPGPPRPTHWSPFEIAASWVVLVTVVTLQAGLFYSLLAHLVNSYRVRLGLSLLEVREGPLPQPNSTVRLAREQIQQLCVRKESRSSDSVYYHLEALTEDGKRFPLLWCRSSAEDLHYIEGVLEKELGLQDRPVSGELPVGRG